MKREDLAGADLTSMIERGLISQTKQETARLLEEQMDSLVELGCDYLQGYYYSKPISEEEFLAFVARKNVL